MRTRPHFPRDGDDLGADHFATGRSKQGTPYEAHWALGWDNQENAIVLCYSTGSHIFQCEYRIPANFQSDSEARRGLRELAGWLNSQDFPLPEGQLLQIASAGCSSGETRSPSAGEYLLRLFAPRERRDDLIGDLEEEYCQVEAKHGHRKAVFWYWTQVVLSLVPLVPRAVKGWLLVTLGQWFGVFNRMEGWLIKLGHAVWNFFSGA